jgi:hypothetical protein
LIILMSPFPPPMIFDKNLKTINEVLPHSNSPVPEVEHRHVTRVNLDLMGGRLIVTFGLRNLFSPAIPENTLGAPYNDTFCSRAGSIV